MKTLTRLSLYSIPGVLAFALLRWGFSPWATVSAGDFVVTMATERAGCGSTDALLQAVGEEASAFNSLLVVSVDERDDHYCRRSLNRSHWPFRAVVPQRLSCRWLREDALAHLAAHDLPEPTFTRSGRVLSDQEVDDIRSQLDPWMARTDDGD